jgi:hypothetical protein
MTARKPNDEAISAVAKILGARGGTKRGQRMTAEERSASARFAGRHRWGAKQAGSWRDLIGETSVAAQVTVPKPKRQRRGKA